MSEVGEIIDTPLFRLRHSAAHLLASAVKELYPDAKLGIGPPIEDGFYYDFEFSSPIGEDALEKIEKKMHEIASKNLDFVKGYMKKEEAIKFFSERNEDYKVEIINSLNGDVFSIYSHGDFVDLCKGPHIENTSQIKYFKLLKIAGAYWRGDEKNKMLTRIYGTAWFTKEDLDNYLRKIEEAKKRDHRELGVKLDLFCIFQEEAGSGLVFWLPKGAVVRKIIEDYSRDLHLKNGYLPVYTPHILRRSLFEKTGHTKYYSEYMFCPIYMDEVEYQLKPMNCPAHALIYKKIVQSYRDLPLRLFELGTVYRYEKQGVLHGLMRVRGFTQDDSHIYITKDMIEQEILGVLKLLKEVMLKFEFKNFKVYISTRPEKFAGSLELWDFSQSALESSVKKAGLNYEIDPGGGVFYGPKIDFHIEDSLGRKWQCGTIQLDFNIANALDLRYTDANMKQQRPVVIHRALFGSIERFFGILIEHYAAAFPFWLAPVQVVVIPISDVVSDYAKEIYLKLKDFRVELSESANTFNYRLREAIVQKIPYIVIVGEREKSECNISYRHFTDNKTYKTSIDEFINMLKCQR
ncbi:MAG: threonine--tRNA ligase [bacterium]|nr:threonine--tRNA ligase [bacterium]